MSFEDEERVRVLIVVFRSAIELAISLVAFIVAIAPIPALANVEAPNSAGYQEVRVPLDPETKAAAGEDGCLGRPGCYPGYSAAISVTSDYVLAGSNEGWLRAFDINNGEVL